MQKVLTYVKLLSHNTYCKCWPPFKLLLKLYMCCYAIAYPPPFITKVFHVSSIRSLKQSEVLLISFWFNIHSYKIVFYYVCNEWLETNTDPFPITNRTLSSGLVIFETGVYLPVIHNLSISWQQYYIIYILCLASGEACTKNRNTQQRKYQKYLRLLVNFNFHKCTYLVIHLGQRWESVDCWG